MNHAPANIQLSKDFPAAAFTIGGSWAHGRWWLTGCWDPGCGDVDTTLRRTRTQRA